MGVALSHRLGTGLGSGVQGLGAEDRAGASLFTVVLGLGAKQPPLDLLNTLATSQSRQVPLPEPFITPIPGSARHWSSLESRGEGQPLLGAAGLGMRPRPGPRRWQEDGQRGQQGGAGALPWAISPRDPHSGSGVCSLGGKNMVEWANVKVEELVRDGPSSQEFGPPGLCRGLMGPSPQ